jgi:hypothetical protein
MVRVGEEVRWGEAKGRIGVRLDLSRVEGGEASVRNSSPRRMGGWRYASSLTHLTFSHLLTQ